MEKLSRPITPVKEFGEAIRLANLSEKEQEIIDYIRYTGVFSQPMLAKDLRLKTKPPALSILCEICRKIGAHIPEHFEAIREWSKAISEHDVKWDGDLVCSTTRNIDGTPLSPEAGTALYDYLAVHKELFTGFD